MSHKGTEPDGGMTLRDYFAAAAMQGIISHDPFSRPTKTHAKVAYEYADAMIAERDKWMRP